MKMGVYRVFLALSLLVLTAQAARADESLLPGLIREPTFVSIALPDGAQERLEALTVRPDRPGRFPLVLMVHGTPRDSTRRSHMSPAAYIGPAVTFASRGYAVVSVMRRGFGRSDGTYAEEYGGGATCGNRDYLRVARISAEDVLGAVAALRAEVWVDRDRIVLLGQSTGGLAVTAAAAANPPGVVGILDFAGGRGSDTPDHVCDEDHLVGAFGEFGKTAGAPALWVFAENDHFFGPDLAHRMLNAYRAGGAPARLVMLPPVGIDGHYALTIAPLELIWPPVEEFLASLTLPTKIVVDLPPMPSLPPPPGVDSGCAALFRNYLDARVEAKAFAINPSGHCGWDVTGPTIEMAKQAAIDSCAQRGVNCTLYAVGQSVVAR